MSIHKNQLNIINILAKEEKLDDEVISQALYLEISVVRYSLEEMEKEGFVKCIKSRDWRGDQSYVLCYLTSKGKAIAQDPRNLIDTVSQRIINTEGGNYNEHIQGNYYEQKGNFGIGHMSGGKIEAGAKVAGVINEAEQQNLTEAAAQIQQLLEQLEKSYPTNTTMGKMAIATEAISQIDSNPTLAARILSALKAGGISAFEQVLNHPAASFVIGALEDWKESKEN